MKLIWSLIFYSLFLSCKNENSENPYILLANKKYPSGGKLILKLYPDSTFKFYLSDVKAADYKEWLGKYSLFKDTIYYQYSDSALGKRVHKSIITDKSIYTAGITDVSSLIIRKSKLDLSN